MNRTLPVSLAASLAVGAMTFAGCSAAEGNGSAAPTALTVATAFYPLEFVAQHVGGEHVDVIALASPGVEPHDLELSPSAVRELSSADLVLYLGEFQPAVDDAIDSTDATGFDAASVVTLHDSEHEHEDDEHAEHEHEDDEHAEDGHEDEDGHDHGAHDPHFWLDPTLLATYATAVGAQFAQLDPANAAAYTANAASLVGELTSLDESFTDGLAQCERDTIVTSHEAFAYLAERYGLEQIGIAGIDPEAEPSPARLLEIREVVETTGTTTIFTESLVNPAVAESIATDTGVTTAVLDPIESVTGDDDYATVMTRNLENLRTALSCA